MNAATLDRMLSARVTIAARSGVDAYGQPTFGTATTVRARVEHKHVRSRTPAGEEFTSTTQVATLASITPGDSLTIDGDTRMVRAVQSATGLRGGTTLTVAML